MTPETIQQPTNNHLDIDPDEQPIERTVDGRTREGRAARAGLDGDAQAGAAPQRAATRTPRRSREPSRDPNRSDGVILGRNGEVLSRTNDESQDQFDVPKNIIPSGWDYQWNTVSVLGSGDVALRHSNRMYANGWRPVPAERHPGRWTAMGHKGDIVVEGLRLEERPQTLTAQALQADERKAKRQISDRNESLMLEVKKGMRDGMSMDRKYRGTGGNMKMSIDPGLDIPAPQHELAEPGE
jgi:hypothetical protein